MNFKDDEIYKQIVADIDKQFEKGIKQYGQTLHDNKEISFHEVVRYRAEELIDEYVYMKKLQEMYFDLLEKYDDLLNKFKDVTGEK